MDVTVVREADVVVAVRVLDTDVVVVEVEV